MPPPNEVDPSGSINHEYLGDGVYACFDGMHIILRLDNHLNTRGQICLDSNVMANLKMYEQSRVKDRG